jgi:hypothetical protein
MEKSGGWQMAGIFRGDEAWGIIKGFYEGKRPHTCLECTFYQPINQELVRGTGEGQRGGEVCCQGLRAILSEFGTRI